jgi:sulfur carrier protein
MELTINNQTKQFTSDCLTIQALLDLEIPLKQNGVAVAINNVVIPKAEWSTHNLTESDAVLLITATQGG